MLYIPIDELAPGMILASDVRSMHGRLLLQKGDVVAEKTVRVCRIWGVWQVPVEHDSMAAAGPSLRESQ